MKNLVDVRYTLDAQNDAVVINEVNFLVENMYNQLKKSH